MDSGEFLKKAEIAAGTGIWELHLDTGQMFGSHGALVLYGLKDTPMDYEKVKNIPLPEYRGMLDKALKELIEEDKPYDIRFKIKNAADGRIIDIHSKSKYDPVKRVLFGSIQDVSAQVKDEEIKRRYAADSATLLEITMDLLETVQKRKAFQKIIEGAVRLIGLDSAALYILQDDDLVIEAAFPDLDENVPAEHRRAKLDNHPHIKKAIEERFPVLISDLVDEHFSEEEMVIIKSRNLQSLVYIPMFAMQQVSGVMILGTIGRKYELSRREIDLCQTLSNISSLALENSLLFEQLKLNIDKLVHTISEKEDTEEKLRLLSRAVEHSPVSIVVTDHNGRIEYVNPKFTSVTGYSREEAMSNNPRILKSGFHHDSFYKNLWATISSGKDWYGEMKNRKKNGDYYWENVLISPMKDERGKITHFVGVKEDITEKKAMLENLISAKNRAEESDRLKTAFLHNISHEIRTPLNAIVGFSTFLNDPDLPAEKRQMYSDIIISSNDQLLYIIDGIMKVSHLETGQVVLKKCQTDVRKLTGTLYNQFKPVAGSRNLEFTLDNGNVGEGTVISTDEGKLKQILSNLLDNAFKFTHDGHVEFGTRKDAEAIEFYVGDSGIGIAEEEQERIFERFYQVRKTGSQIYSGTGIGLSICAGYAALLGGKLDVKSNPGLGSVFTLTLPVNSK